MRPVNSSHSLPVAGIALKLASVVVFAGMAACVKVLGPGIPAGQLLFVRGLISVVVLSLIAWQTASLHLLTTRNWRSHALRSVFGTASMFCLFLSLTMLPLADLTAISFTTPLFLTVLAMVFLGEKIHHFRWAALIVGFIGVIIIIGPHLSFAHGASAGVWIALTGALLSAIAMAYLRSMAGREHVITITFYFSLTFMSCAALTALQGWPMPTPGQWVLILLAGFLGVGGQLLMTYAYRYAEASTIAPLDYSNMILAIALGWAFFEEVPTLSVWIGAPLIVAAGLLILWREYRLKKRISAPTPES